MSNSLSNDRRRLEHILEAIDYALRGYAALGDEQLKDGDLRYFGLIQLIQTVREAAYKLSRAFKAAHPETPWQFIIKMRHILVHDYDRIEESFIWRVLQDDLSPLKAQIEQQLATLPE